MAESQRNTALKRYANLHRGRSSLPVKPVKGKGHRVEGKREKTYFMVPDRTGQTFQALYMLPSPNYNFALHSI